jgi:hypothetical protein
MPQLDSDALRACIGQLERTRNSRVLVLAASHLDLEMLPALYDHCREIGRTPRLDVLLHGRGGIVNAARRIALLLRQHAEHLAFIVPFHCQSAATLLTLCADEIVAGELALFSPIDPQLNGADGTAFSGLDIKLFGDMAEQWFGLDSSEARQQSLALLVNSVFPPSLTAFYRTALELAQIGEELLAYQLPTKDPAFRSQVIHQLMSCYHSHNYALTRDEMESLGLCIRRDATVEQAAWDISKLVQATVGGGLRDSTDDPWNDALFATRDSLQVRHKQTGGLAPQWTVKRFAS